MIIWLWWPAKHWSKFCLVIYIFQSGGWLLCKEGSEPTGFNDNVDLFCDDLQFVEMCGKCFDKFRVSIGLDFRLQRSGCLWTSLMSLTSEMQKLWNYNFFTPKCEPECKFKSKDNRPQLKMGANTKFYDIAYSLHPRTRVLIWDLLL